MSVPRAFAAFMLSYTVRDSILRERLADAGYEEYRIEEDKNGDPVPPHLNWAKALPWRNPDEDEERVLESVYTYHPFDGTKMLDASQMNYRYETFDYALAAQRKYRLNPEVCSRPQQGLLWLHNLS